MLCWLSIGEQNYLFDRIVDFYRHLQGRMLEMRNRQLPYLREFYLSPKDPLLLFRAYNGQKLLWTVSHKYIIQSTKADLE